MPDDPAEMSTREPGPRDARVPPPGPAVPARLLVDRIGTWLVDDERGVTAAGAAALRNARPDLERFAKSARRPASLVSVELSIRGHRTHRRTVYGALPGPIALLVVCAQNCVDGDLVTVRQVTAQCGALQHEARWPFGPDEAEIMTRPVAATFAALDAAGVRHVRRWSRRLGRLGTVHIERAVGRCCARRAGFATWHDDLIGHVRGIAVVWRARSFWVGLGRPAGRAGSGHQCEGGPAPG